MNIAIIYSADWARYAAIEVLSIFSTNPAPIKVYLISDENGKMDLSEMCKHFGDGYNVEFINGEPMYKQAIPSTVNVSSRFTKFALYRLLLPDLIHDDKLLYIDADAVVNGDITELYNMPFNGNIILGAEDVEANKYNLKTPIGFQPNDLYINAGIMLMDLKTIRNEKIHHKWIHEANTKKYACHDQCIINKTCRNRIGVFKNKFNTSPSTGIDTGKESIRIMHYAGPKPWNNATVPHPHIWKYWESEYTRRFSTINVGNFIIPKIIHYCWFGGRPKPPIVQKCIDSWRKYLPDYQIREWNETNFNVSSNKFARDAFISKKYAFVTDYVRLSVLLNQGGIYMDSDVEVLKNLDCFLHHKAFTGHETNDLMVTAIMGAVPNHPWIKLLLRTYSDRQFSTVPNTNIITDISKPLVVKEENGFRYLRSDVVIYPVETFCPFDHKNLRPTPTENSYTIHHFAGTWLNRTIV